MKTLALISSFFLLTNTLLAQENSNNTIIKARIEADTNNPGQNTLTISSNGIEVVTPKMKYRTVIFKSGGLDLGLNMLMHGTDYSSPVTQSFLNVPTSMQNDDLFALKQGNSWNVNIWPLLMQVRLVKSKNFRFNINTGLGMQIYNFKYKKNIIHTDKPSDQIFLDDQRDITKNKLSLMYVSIPVKMNFQHRINEKHYLTYSLGVIGGVNASTWTKTISKENGTQKNHDLSYFNPFNLNVVGEIGITNGVSLYATYQVTNMYNGENANHLPNALIQNPLSIGIKLTGF